MHEELRGCADEHAWACEVRSPWLVHFFLQTLSGMCLCKRGRLQCVIRCPARHTTLQAWNGAGGMKKTCPGRDGGLWPQSQILGVRGMGNGMVDEALHVQVSSFPLGVIFVLFCLKTENQGRP